GLAAGTYTVTPSKSGYTFAQPALSVTVGPSQSGVDFTASSQAFRIRGTVTLNGKGVQGVSISAGGQSALTAIDGTYALALGGAGTYTVRPAKTGLTFSPTFRS